MQSATSIDLFLVRDLWAVMTLLLYYLALYGANCFGEFYVPTYLNSVNCYASICRLNTMIFQMPAYFIKALIFCFLSNFIDRGKVNKMTKTCVMNFSSRDKFLFVNILEPCIPVNYIMIYYKKRIWRFKEKVFRLMISL